MAWGRQDWTPYRLPDFCDWAAVDMQLEVKDRNIPAWPVVDDTAADTLPTAVIAVARACGAQFTPASVKPEDLWSYFRLALARQNIAQASQALDRKLALAKTPQERADIVSAAMDLYLGLYPTRVHIGSHPVQLAAAQALFRRLEALGPAVWQARFDERNRFINYWHGKQQDDSVRRLAEEAIAYSKTLSPVQRDSINAPAPYQALFSVLDPQDVGAQKALIRRVLTDLGSWRGGQGGQALWAEQQLVSLRAQFYTRVTKPLRGKYWFNDGNTPHPAPDVVSLLVNVNGQCGAECYGQYALLKALRDHYGKALDITMLVDTYGYFMGSGPIPADSEAKAIAHYFLDVLHLPVTLLVSERPVVKQPDGHITYQNSQIGGMFGGWNGMNALMIDQKGKIQWLGSAKSLEDRHMLEAVIGKAIGSASATGSATGG